MLAIVNYGVTNMPHKYIFCMMILLLLNKYTGVG